MRSILMIRILRISAGFAAISARKLATFRDFSKILSMEHQRICMELPKNVACLATSIP